MTDPVGLDKTLGELLSRFGLPHPEVMDRISSEWAEVAGNPWDEKSKPVLLRSGVLVVEVSDRASLGMLRYGVDGLATKLTERYGTDLIQSVELRAAP
ncbi:MAG: DUF721 domain-containing protein [Acidimicrobiia bacterium]|nr:DUF721 domain-containing protein [Acidimicrobiia bacterium]